MRIISGSARGRHLAGPRGDATRPTSDRVREALFSMLRSRLGTFEGSRVLDLFAGTGALALEALSRGAARAVLIEQDRRAAEVIAANIAACCMQPQAVLRRGEVLKSLSRLQTEGPFDLILLDPPYGQGLASRVLTGIAERQLLAPGGIICVETARDEEIADTVGDLHRLDRRHYGSTAVHLYAQESEAAQP